jgi:hypothetical protein
VEVALGRVAKSSGTALESVGFSVGAGAEGHSNMLFNVHTLCQIESGAILSRRRGDTEGPKHAGDQERKREWWCRNIQVSVRN